MRISVVAVERQRSARYRLVEELIRRQLARKGGWSHCGAQFGTEPTSLALLALFSPPSGSRVTPQDLAQLKAHRQPHGLWPAVGGAAAGGDFWATAMAVNALMILGAAPRTLAASLDELLRCRPLEA